MQDEAIRQATGTYVHDTFDITVTELNHGFSQGTSYSNFTSGSSPSGFYDVTPVNANEYTVIVAVPLLTSVTTNARRSLMLLEQLTHLLKTLLTGQLSSTNIDASNIVAGTIDPERLGSTV